MHQQLAQTAGSHGRRCEIDELEICGHLVFRLRPVTMPVTDQAALAEGMCPDCRVRLAGVTGTWCGQCDTYWPYDGAALMAAAALLAAGRTPAASPRAGAS